MNHQSPHSFFSHRRRLSSSLSSSPQQPLKELFSVILTLALVFYVLILLLISNDGDNTDGYTTTTRDPPVVRFSSPPQKELLQQAVVTEDHDSPARFNEGKVGDRSVPIQDKMSVWSADASAQSNGKLETDQSPPTGLGVDYNEVFHDEDIFLENYQEMSRSLKVYVYPHRKNDPFANILSPSKDEPGGNYASETYFKNVLMKSQFITKDPSKADLFFLPFSIATLRNDRRIGVGGLQDFIRNYVLDIIHRYPYWNRTGGADHFYAACHSVGKLAMEKEYEIKLNAIQVICSSSYFLTNYVAHKDISLPQIWPRHGLVDLASAKRKKLAFFAGAMNAAVRKKVVNEWKSDSEIFVHKGRLKTPYDAQLLGSKFCLHVKGFEVNTARIGDSLYYGCIPVILADYYDLPFMDILNWKSFSVVVATADIPSLKNILKGISRNQLSLLQANVLKVRRHFQWNLTPTDYDAFYMVMYELWLRRSSIRLIVNDPIDYKQQ